MATMIDTYVKSAWSYVRDAPVTVHLIVGAVSLYAVYRLAFKKKYRLPPGPRGLPLLGNLASLGNDSLMEVMSEWHKKYGPVVTMYLGPRRTILLGDIETTMEALVTRGSDCSGRPFFYSIDIMTRGSKDISAASFGDTWKYQRKVASQSLRQYLSGDQFSERVNEVLKIVVKEIESQKDPFVLKDILSLSVFNVLHGLCFGTTMDFKDEHFAKLMACIDMVTDEAGNGFLEDLFPIFQHWHTKKFTKFVEGINWVSSYIEQKMVERKSEFDKDSIRCLADTVLLAQQELIESDSAALVHMTDVHAAQIMLDVFGAGVDTTRSTLDWIFLVLVAYPEIQTRMQKEIDEVVGERMPGKEHRAKLVYTEAVFLETMRLYVVTPMSVPHETMCDTSVGGYEIPAKTMIMINEHLILRDPKHWDDPLAFKPERFMSEDGTKISSRNRSFIPFSLGHRSCPGESLAKLEIVYIVVGLLQKLTFSLPPGEKADFTGITNFSKFRAEAYKVIAKPR